MMKYDIKEIKWNDLLLSEVNLDGENINIKIQSQDNQYEIIHCEDYLGIKCLGKWEDRNIESITIEESGKLMVESMFNIKRNYKDNNYCVSTPNKPWIQLNIQLSNGCCVQIACKNSYIVD